MAVEDEEVAIFIDDFLAHWERPHYDPRKAHEYYMKTRKLVGKGVKKVQNIDLNPLNNDNKTLSPNQARVKAIQDKLDRIDGAVKKLPPDRRNVIQKKLDDIRAKLHKIHKPSKTHTIDRSGPAVRVDRADTPFEAAKRKLPKHGGMRFNPKARLDTSQIQDKRAKDDPTRGHKSAAERKRWHEKRVVTAQAKVDRVGKMLDKVIAQQKKTPLYDVRKQYKLVRLHTKLLDEYKKAIAARDAAEGV